MSTPPTNPARLGLAALVAVAYLGASAWLIRGQGQEYRKRLREERSALARNLDPPPAVEAKRPEKTAEPPDVPGAEAVSPPLVVKSVAKPSPPPEERESPPDPTPAVARIPDPPPSTPATTKPVPAPKAINPFWEQPEQKKVWDLDRLTVEDERQLGEALHQMVLQFHQPIDEGPLPRRVEDAAEPYLKSLSKSGLKYTFTVLDCDQSNAFSHPGGYIYVCKGVFDWIAADEDYALEFLLAHEIAHVDLNHAFLCLSDPKVRELKAATVPLFYSLIIPWGYLDEQEFEADQWAAKRMSQAGKSKREILAFLRKLDDYADKNGFANKKRKPPEDPRIAPLDHHLRSHPVPRNRLKSLLEAMDRPPKSG